MKRIPRLELNVQRLKSNTADLVTLSTYSPLNPLCLQGNTP